jgi:hypothetical protein
MEDAARFARNPRRAFPGKPVDRSVRFVLG